MADEDLTRSVDPTVMPQAGTAERALAEAAARRTARAAAERPRPREIDGRQGPEPVRYGDWEKNGIAHDF